jgi:hypothetical protein
MISHHSSLERETCAIKGAVLQQKTSTHVCMTNLTYTYHQTLVSSYWACNCKHSTNSFMMVASNQEMTTTSNFVDI